MYDIESVQRHWEDYAYQSIVHYTHLDECIYSRISTTQSLMFERVFISID